MSIKVTSDSVVMSKPFSLLELEVGECLGFECSADQITARIDRTSKIALAEFLKFAFKNFSTNPKLAAERKLTYLQIGEAYERDYNNFLKEYKPEEMYNNVKDRDGNTRKIDDYQIKSIYDMRNRRANLLGMEQGAGKTITSASISKLLGIKRTVIVSIAAPKFNWLDDLSKGWGFPDTDFTMLDASRCNFSFLYERYVVINYEMIDKYFPHLIRDDVGHIIFDECQKIKGSSTDLFKSALKLVKHFPKAKVSFLSGTPIKNNIIDMYAYLKLARHPLGRDLKAFKARFTEVENKVVKAKDINLFRLMTSNFTIRIKINDVVEMPKLTISKTYIKSNNKSQYESAMAEAYNKGERFKVVSTEIELLTPKRGKTPEEVALLKRLVKEKNELRIAKRSNSMKLNRINSYRKVPAAIEIIDKLVNKGEKVVVFSFFSDTVHAINKHYGPKAVMVEGATPAKKRMDYVNEFMKSSKTRVFVAQGVAGGVGINLFNSCHGFAVDLPFTPSDLEQPITRLYRRGQKRDVSFGLLMIEGSIDDHVYNNILTGKSNDINEILDKDHKDNIKYSEVASQEMIFDSLMEQYKQQLSK